MGRAAYTYLKHAWANIPLPMVRDSGAGTAWGSRCQWPFLIQVKGGTGFDPGASDSWYWVNAPLPYNAMMVGQLLKYDLYAPVYPQRGGPGVLLNESRWTTWPTVAGYCYSATSVTATTAPTTRLGARTDGAGAIYTDVGTTALSGGTNVVGIVPGYQGAGTSDTVRGPETLSLLGATTGLGDNNTSPRSISANAVGSTSDDIQGFGINMFGAPGTMYNASQAAIIGDKEGSSQSGTALGAMTTIVLHEASCGTSQTDLAVRRWKAPFDCRVLKITYGCESSAAGNSLELYNSTTTNTIATNTDLEAKGSTDVEPDAAAFNMANRNISYNDEIDLLATTDVTGGFTNAYAVLTVVVKSVPWAGTENDRLFASFNSNIAVDHDDTSLASTSAVLGDTVTRNMSGPVIGAPIALYIGGMTSGTTQTDEPLQSIIAPFEMDVYVVWLTCQGTDGSNTNTMKVRNITTSTDITGDTTASTASSPNADQCGNTVYNTTAPVRIKRGDEIGVFATTGATAITSGGAILVGVARGFPYDNAALD